MKKISTEIDFKLYEKLVNVIQKIDDAHKEAIRIDNKLSLSDESWEKSKEDIEHVISLKLNLYLIAYSFIKSYEGMISLATSFHDFVKHMHELNKDNKGLSIAVEHIEDLLKLRNSLMESVSTTKENGEIQ